MVEAAAAVDGAQCTTVCICIPSNDKAAGYMVWTSRWLCEGVCWCVLVCVLLCTLAIEAVLVVLTHRRLLQLLKGYNNNHTLLFVTKTAGGGDDSVDTAAN